MAAAALMHSGIIAEMWLQVGGTPVAQHVKKGAQDKRIFACSQYLMQRSLQHRALACAVPTITVSAHV